MFKTFEKLFVLLARLLTICLVALLIPSVAILTASFQVKAQPLPEAARDLIRSLDASKSVQEGHPNAYALDLFAQDTLDKCTPFAYHKHDYNHHESCAHALLSAKEFCTSSNSTGAATLQGGAKSCSDPRYQNFLVNVYGTPQFNQVLSHSQNFTNNNTTSGNLTVSNSTRSGIGINRTIPPTPTCSIPPLNGSLPCNNENKSM